jgi:hypothetical protein
MPGELIQLGDASKIKELQDQLAAKDAELVALQTQFDDFRNSVFLLISSSELLKLQINEIAAFLQTNVKNFQSILQNLQAIKSKIPSVTLDK